MQHASKILFIFAKVIKKEKNIKQRSLCPVSCSLDLIGDKWMLIIVRDIMFFGKKTFKEFLESPEKIATNILNDRLSKLIDYEIIGFTGETRKKYFLTEKGMDLKPLLESMAMFGAKHIDGSKEYMEKMSKHIM